MGEHKQVSGEKNTRSTKKVSPVSACGDLDRFGDLSQPTVIAEIAPD